MDAAIEAAIKAAAPSGTVFSVNYPQTQFSEQVLKVDVLEFHSAARLILTSESPWVAVVVNKLQFDDPNSGNAIGIDLAWTPQAYSKPPAPNEPQLAADGGQCQNGSLGSNGFPGTTGHTGDSAPHMPSLYIVAGAIVDKFGNPLPQSLNLVIDVNGINGGNGGDGGDGGIGGQGGKGGPGRSRGPSMQYPGGHCDCSCGNGGIGGIGGTGGTGGVGGNGSNACDIYQIAPQSVLESLSYATVHQGGGQGGTGGMSGASGVSGRGGNRHGAVGRCGDSAEGTSPHTPPTPRTKAPTGWTPTDPGQTWQEKDDNVGRFFA